MGENRDTAYRIHDQLEYCHREKEGQFLTN